MHFKKDLKLLKMNKNIFNYTSFLLILVALAWAGSFIVVDATVKQIQPITIAFLRFLIATPFMIFSIFIFKKNQLIKLNELHYFIILGLTGVTLLYLFQYLGIERTTAATSAVLINTNVIFISIFSVLFLKENITKTYRLLSQRGELITHLELGTLFLLHAADFYLKENGYIAFVLPRSIFTGDQHDSLRQGTFTGVNLSFYEVWDLEYVKPLFNVPSCVLFCEKKKDVNTNYPIAVEIIDGHLDQRNVSLHEADNSLSINAEMIYLHKRGNRHVHSRGCTCFY